jgi:DNA-binding MarR family transcriptional regulator
MTEPGSGHSVNDLLKHAGIAEPTIEAIIRIDALMQHWRRRAMKRELGHRALQDLKIDIDLAQLDVLVAIEAPVDEFGEQAGGETMVGSVAERLAIDPSRASRIVSEMVDGGYARRAVSQADARRSIIELTPRGQAIVEAVRAYKFLIMGHFLADWSAEDLAQFVPMLQRFGRWADHTELGSERFAAEIETLAKSLAPQLEEEPA